MKFLAANWISSAWIDISMWTLSYICTMYSVNSTIVKFKLDHFRCVLTGSEAWHFYSFKKKRVESTFTYNKHDSAKMLYNFLVKQSTGSHCTITLIVQCPRLKLNWEKWKKKPLKLCNFVLSGQKIRTLATNSIKRRGQTVCDWNIFLQGINITDLRQCSHF